LAFDLRENTKWRVEVEYRFLAEGSGAVRAGGKTVAEMPFSKDWKK
jgi:hypothetical protein